MGEKERLKELRENGTGDGRDSSANFTTGRETGGILVHILPGGREKHGIPDTRDERLASLHLFKFIYS